jgi:hypothetical protein
MAFAELYRQRLHDLPWFLRVLDASIAHQANAEDDCTGRFWEGRFKSQALLAAIADVNVDLNANVNLNAIRAEMAESLLESTHTFIDARLAEAPLMPFDVTGRVAQAVPFGFEEYLDLVAAMGRAVRPRKRGVIAANTPLLLRRLGMNADAFIACTGHFFKAFANAVGTPAKRLEVAG